MGACLAAAASPGGAQELVTVAGDETYCECRVVLERVVTLGDTAGPGALLGTVRNVQRNSSGVYHVLAWRENKIYRFTPTGEALSPLLGEGQGPGEATLVSNFLIWSDSVFAFDPRQGRVSVFGPDGEFVRTFPRATYVYDAVRDQEGLVVNSRGVDRMSFGYPLHTVTESGEVLRSFGSDGTVTFGQDNEWLRHLVGAEGSIWAAPQNQYRLEQWSRDGRALRVVEREVEWFLPRRGRTWGPDKPMPPRISHFAVDGRGYLRVSIIRGGPRWAELLQPAVQTEFAGAVYPVPPGTGLFETVLEVVDPDTGTLIARGVVEAEVWGFVDSEHVFSYLEDAVGNPTVTIWRLRLEPL